MSIVTTNVQMCLRKRNGTKKIQLEGKAKKKVANAIALFQTDVRLAKNEFSKVPFEALNTVLYYKHVQKTLIITSSKKITMKKKKANNICIMMAP